MAGAFSSRAPKITNISICGSQTSIEAMAGAAIGGQRAVYIDADGVAQYAGCDVLENNLRTLGITLNAAALGEPLVIQTFGRIEEPSWNWTLDIPVYLGLNGQLTQTLPTMSALFHRILGFPLSATSLFLSQREPIVLAPT